MWINRKHPLRLWFLFLVLTPCLIVMAFALVRSAFGFRDIAAWQVTEQTNIAARILWQKAVPCLTTNYSTWHGALAVSGSTVLIHRACIGTDGHYIGLDAVTGEQRWQFRANGSFQITAVEAFLAVFADSYLLKIAESGEILWRTERFPSRSMRAVYVDGETIYAPFRTSTATGIHLIASETGEISETVSGENIVAMFGDYTTRLQTESLQIFDNDTEELVQEIVIGNYRLRFDDIIRIDNLLIFPVGRYQTRAYDFTTGKIVWEIAESANASPVLIGNRLYFYTADHRLAVYDPLTGQPLGQLRLSRSEQSQDAGAADVAIAGDENVIAVAYRERGEIVVLDLR